MGEVETEVTRTPGAAVLGEVRSLLEQVFVGEFTAEDWEHALGGVHVLLREDGQLVGHAALVERRLWTRGVTLRTGYVEAVAVRAGRRRRGHGARLMDAVERELRSGDYALGALSSSRRAVGFYRARDWQQWLGPTSVRTAAGIVRTEDEDGGVYVLDVDLGFDLFAGLTCDWREGDVW